MRTWWLGLLIAIGCGKGPPMPGMGNTKSATEGSAAAAAANADNEEGSAAKGPHVLGEKLTPREIKDTQQGLTLGVVAVPESWTYEAKVAWTYGNVSNPLTAESVAANPNNAEAVFGYSNYQLFDLQPRGGYTPGKMYGGIIYAPPMQPLDALVQFVRTQRKDATNAAIVGGREMPELASALKIPDAPNQKGIALKITYELDGKAIEEEFYAVHYVNRIPYDGPQGRTYQINWGLIGVHSFRALAGTLDKRRAVFAAVVKSFRANPAWEARRDKVIKYLADQFNRQLKAGYDQIAAAGRLSRQISANNDAFIAQMDSQRAAANRTSGGTGLGVGGSTGNGGDAEGRSSNDKFDDYVRGVDTVDDPYYGTSQHSSNDQYHWTDGYGNYRNTNDPSADPNRSDVGEWTLMPSSK